MIFRWVVKHRIPIPDIANSKMFYTVHKTVILRIVPQKTLSQFWEAALYKRVIQRNIKEAITEQKPMTITPYSI